MPKYKYTGESEITLTQQGITVEPGEVFDSSSIINNPDFELQPEEQETAQNNPIIPEGDEK
jgi:hypothetical protein